MDDSAVLAGLFASHPHPLCVVTETGRFATRNPMWSQQFAASQPQARDQQALAHCYQMCRSNGQSTHHTLRLVTHEQGQTLVDLTVFGDPTTGNVFALAAGPPALAAIEQVEGTPITCAVLDTAGRIEHWVGEGTALAGYPLKIGASLLELGPWDLPPEDWWPGILAGNSEQSTLALDEVWLDVWFSPRTGPQGIDGVYALIIDTSMHHLASSAMDATEELLRGVLTSMPMVLIAINRERRILMIEGAQAQAFSLAPGEGIGQLAEDVFAQTPAIHQGLKKALAGESSKLIAEVGRQHFKIWSTPFFDDRGERSGATAVAADITARMRYEQMLLQRGDQLRVARDQALQASRAKTEFLAVMSHELRTPLNAIIGFSEVLHDLASGEQKADLARVLAAANHLLTLINDVLELSRIEAGRSRIDRRRFVLGPLLDQAIAYAKKCNPDAATSLVLPENLELGEMLSDRAKVAQIFENLLDNAVKFTPKGTVTLSVEHVVGDTPEVLFTVTDTGIGMDEDTLAQLFTAFYQADSSATRPYGGTGIGLTITEQFCRLLGGKIEVTSRLGEGSTFRVYLPRDLVVG